VSRITVAESNKKTPQIVLEPLLVCEASFSHVVGSQLSTSGSVLPEAPVCVTSSSSSSSQLDNEAGHGNLVSVGLDMQQLFSVPWQRSPSLRAMRRAYVWKSGAVVVDRSGFTVGVRNGKVAWFRDEGLSRVRKVMMLDGAQSSADQVTVPSLHRRLSLQAAEISVILAFL